MITWLRKARRALAHVPLQTPRAGYPCYSQSGFTLVEVLVTLVILAMVAAVAFGSLGQVFEARARLRPYLDESEKTTLVADWFRATERCSAMNKVSAAVLRLLALSMASGVPPASPPSRCSVMSLGWSFCVDDSGSMRKCPLDRRENLGRADGL